MNSKAIIAIVAVVIIVVAAVAVFALPSNNDVPSDSVRYKGNGGLYNGNSSYDAASDYVMPCAFTYDGHHFTSWNTKADGTGTTYAVESKVPLKTVLYAQWSNANVLGAVNLYSSTFNLYVAQKGQENMTNIDSSESDLAPTDAILVVTSVLDGSTISIDDRNRVVIKSDKAEYLITLSIPSAKLTLGEGHVLSTTTPTVYFDIIQDGKNDRATLGISVLKTSTVS